MPKNSLEPLFFTGIFTEGGGGGKKSLSGIKQRNALNPELCTKKTEGVDEEKEEGHSQCSQLVFLCGTCSFIQGSLLFSLLIVQSFLAKKLAAQTFTP